MLGTDVLYYTNKAFNVRGEIILKVSALLSYSDNLISQASFRSLFSIYFLLIYMGL
jgi:hypothetical protein